MKRTSESGAPPSNPYPHPQNEQALQRLPVASYSGTKVSMESAKVTLAFNLRVHYD